MRKSNYKKHNDIKTMCCKSSYNNQSKLSNTKFITQNYNMSNLKMWEDNIVSTNKNVNNTNIKFFKRPISKIK